LEERSDEHAEQLAAVAAHGQDRHVVIDHALERFARGPQRGDLGLGVFPSIDGERALAFALVELGRLQVLQGLAYGRHHLVLHPIRVLGHQTPLRVVQGVVVHQVVLEHRPAVIVREGQHELGPIQREASAQLGVEALVDRLRHAHVIGGGEDHAFAVRGL